MKNGEDILKNPHSGQIIKGTTTPIGYKDFRIKATRICPCCKEEYVRYYSEIDYEIDLGFGVEPIILCSHTCKHRYLREHYDEIEKKRKKYAKKYEKVSKPYLF